MSRTLSRNYFSLILAAALFAISLSGCGEPEPSKTATTSPPATPAAAPATTPPADTSKSLTEFRLGYFPNLTHAQAVLEVSNGDLAKALGPDVKLSTKTFNAGPAAIDDDAGRLIDDLTFDVGVDRPNGRYTDVDRIVHAGLKGNRRRFRSSDVRCLRHVPS